MTNKFETAKKSNNEQTKNYANNVRLTGKSKAKTIFIGLFVLVLAIAVGITTLVGCDTTNQSDLEEAQKQQQRLSAYEELLSLAEDSGYTGTLEELIEACKGDSAYDVAVANGYTGTESEWLATLVGATGTSPSIGTNGHWFVGEVDTGVNAQGEKGEKGVGISAFEKTDTVGNVDYYTVTYTDGTTTTFTITNGKDGANGKDGSDGKNGQDGKDGQDGEYAAQGLSAYEIAVEQGFDGTEEAWLASLQGKNGQSAYEIAVANGYSGTIQDWIIANYPTTAENETADANAIIASKAVLSVVSVYANFTYKVRTWSGTTTQSATSAGAGVIFQDDKANGDAYIITNFHVVYAYEALSTDVSVFLYGYEMTQYAIPVQIIGGSMTNDIAVLKISGSDIYKNSASIPATIGVSSTLTPGQTAIAVGNPDAAGIAVNVGTISKLFETIDLTLADDSTTGSFRVIRYDTPVNEGNSGGGLFDSKGRLIGIVNAKSSTEDDFNYALPIDVMSSLARSIIRNCDGDEVLTTEVATIGIMTNAGACKSVVDTSTGLTRIQYDVVVAEVQTGTTADGVFEVGDIIKSFTYDDVTVDVVYPYTTQDYRYDWIKDTDITFTVLRGGETINLTFTLTNMVQVK